MTKKVEVKKPKTTEEKIVANLERARRRCCTVARNLRSRASELIEEANQNETKAASYAKVLKSMGNAQ